MTISRRVPENQATVEDAVYESLQTQALREGIRRLPEIQKRRLQMYFFDGLTYEEIAERERCSYHEVNKYQHKRALALTARKLVRLVFRLLKDNRLYIPPEG